MAAYEKLPYWADVKLTGGMLAEIQTGGSAMRNLITGKS